MCSDHEQTRAPTSREVTEENCDQLLLNAAQLRMHGDQSRAEAAAAPPEVFGRASTAEAASKMFAAIGEALDAMAGRIEHGVDAAWQAQNAEDGVEDGRRGSE